ncbi:MAG: glutamate--cysteine ligase [Proteobacteria bacterium]|nr:MAG: glutamate--cysteine ligase [Pseudomonadota bacterium]
MASLLEQNINALQQGANSCLQEIGRGIEKEGLRTTRKGVIAQTDHPAALGHPLTHPQITTDYAESLLELITPVLHSPGQVIDSITDIHRFVQKNLDDELIWAGSMPCIINGEESIVVGKYGDSNLGRIKHVYRQGLGVRYGRVMQSIAGMHYNFSLPDTFWTFWHEYRQSRLSLQDFKSEEYFALIRNFRRYSWLVMYLFGASPAMDQSFLEPHQLEKSHPDLKRINNRSAYMPYATSLRMGDMGYHNNAQSSLAICFNKLDSFVSTLDQAIHTPYARYQETGTERNGEFIQLSTNILQIENEYYSSIRPKRTIFSGEKPIHALEQRGVEYIEVRCLDLDPYSPVGATESQIRFMDAFLVFCLLTDSPWIQDEECKRIDSNFDKTVTRGRQPGLKLQSDGGEVLLTGKAEQLFEQLSLSASLLDHSASPDSSQQNANLYQKAVSEQRLKLDHPELTPSGQMILSLENDHSDYVELVCTLSEQHQKKLNARPLDDACEQSLINKAKESFLKEKALKDSDNCDFATYLNQYLM